MTYRIEFQRKSSYLHVIVEGENTRENVVKYLEDIRLECVAQGVLRVLIEERLEGPRLDASEVFGIVSTASGKSMGVFRALAYVDVHADSDTMKFAETVAVNRGIPVRLFSAVADAEKWLEGRW